MHSSSITAVSSPAKGTPAIARPMPPRPACTTAVTPTPERHAADGLSGQRDRVVAVDAGQAPAEAVHRHARRASPPEYISAASTTVSRNCTNTRPTLPACETNHLAMSSA